MSDEKVTQSTAKPQTASSQPSREASSRPARTNTGSREGDNKAQGGYRGNNPRGAAGSRTPGTRGPNRGPGGRGPGGPGGARGRAGGRDRNNRRGRGKKEEEQDDLITKVIDVRRVTRVVRGGKRMRFAALVVVGDGKGKVGFGFKKGMDFQDSVAKATKIAKGKMFKVKLNEQFSIPYPIQIKNKSCKLFMKPAPEGTGLIAGGYLRPVLELAGVKNIFTKNLGSSNKILGVQTTMQVLEDISNNTPTQQNQ